ncbi:MAG: hypothetical protein IJX74_03055 [Clostridia bacterium]|nr:hypothetical protein [Clostridia bacterium]
MSKDVGSAFLQDFMFVRNIMSSGFFMLLSASTESSQRLTKGWEDELLTSNFQQAQI